MKLSNNFQSDLLHRNETLCRKPEKLEDTSDETKTVFGTKSLIRIHWSTLTLTQEGVNDTE